MPMFKVICKLHTDDEWDWFSVLAIVFTHRMGSDRSLMMLLLWSMCRELSSHLKGKVSQKYSCHLAYECVLSHFSRVWLFVTSWIVVTSPLCPWNSPGKSTGVGCHTLLPGIFLSQGSDPGLLHCKQSLYHLSHQGSRSSQIREGKFNEMDIIV